MGNDDIRREIDELKREVYNINCKIANLERELDLNKNINVDILKSKTVQKPVLRTKDSNSKLDQKKTLDNFDKPKKDIENSLGKNIMVILASLLIFIGLSSLIVLLFDNITDIMKLALIYIFTLGFSGYGLYLVNKKKNIFSLGLSSCGLGSVYISILVTYFVYSYINEILLFILLMSWSCFIIFMNNRLKSDIYLFISNLGILIALFLGFNYESNILLYLILFISYFISGYYFCIFSKIKNVYLKFYLDLVYLLSLGFILDNYIYSSIQNICLSLLYFVIIPIFLYFIYNNFYESVKEDNIRFKNILLSFLGFLSLFLLNYLSMYNLIESEIFKVLGNYSYIGYAFILYLLVYGSIVLYYKSFDKVNNKFICDLILYFVVFISNMILLDELNEFIVYGFSLAFLVLPFLVTGVRKKDKFFLNLSTFTFAESTFYLYDNIRKIIKLELNLPFFLISLLFFFLIHFIFVIYKDKNEDFEFNIISYLSCFSVLYFILELIFYNYNDYIILMIMILSLYVLFVPKLFKGNLDKFVLPINKFLNGVLLFASLNEMYYNDELHVILLLLVSVITVIQAVIYLVQLVKERTKYSGFYIGLKITSYILIMLKIYLKAFTDISYIYSVVLIVLAILFILSGFKYNYKEFRLYGLILSFIGVLKLILIDINFEASILRVCSFIFAGILCFIISYIYNRMDEKLK